MTKTRIAKWSLPALGIVAGLLLAAWGLGMGVNFLVQMGVLLWLFGLLWLLCKEW